MMTDRPLQLLHMDLFGLIAYISIAGSKYCLVIVDDYSCFTWVFFLQEKSQTQQTLKRFLRQFLNEFGMRIKKIRSDNGTVAEPPKLLGPHAPAIVLKTSDGYACAPDNLTGSVRVPQGPRINHLQPGPQY
jgi:hypothetical protein